MGGILTALVCTGLATCGSPERKSPPVSAGRPINVPAETKRTADYIDARAGEAANGRYNRFTWMTDGTFCYRTETRAEIVKSCFSPIQIDRSRVQAYAGNGGFDQVALNCRTRACIRRSFQERHELGPHRHEKADRLFIVAPSGEAPAVANAVRYLLWLSEQARESQERYGNARVRR